MKLELRELLEQTAAALLAGSEDHPELELLPPRKAEHGDLASDIGFKLSKVLKRSPLVLAEEARRILEKELKPRALGREIREIRIVPPGYLNFYFSPRFFARILEEIAGRDGRYGESEAGAQRPVLLEYVSANPTGPLTIAHGRQACIGDALARILRMAGYRPHREYYMNDAGRQMNLLGRSLHARYAELAGEKDYPLPEDGYQGEYLLDIAREVLREKGREWVGRRDEAAEEYFRTRARETIFEGIRRDLAEAKVEFDTVTSERSLFESGAVERCLGELREKKVLFEEAGALWLRTEPWGDDKNRVLRKSSGETTYLMPDLAYHAEKFRRGFSLLVNLWGPDHHGYIARLKAGLSALGFDPGHVRILIVQLTTLYRGGEPVRMSTRKGEFITFRELLDEVGPDAARFFFLMRRIESHLDFDLELAKKKSDENPVFYLQYAHARIASILRKSERPVPGSANLELLDKPEELELIRKLGEFPDMIYQAARFLEPYRIVDYLRDTAQTFHRFYAFHRVISEDPSLTDARLFLVNACRIVLRNALNALGISAPDSM